MRLIKGMIYTEKMCFEPGGLTIEGDRIKKIERYGEETLTERTGNLCFAGTDRYSFSWLCRI